MASVANLSGTIVTPTLNSVSTQDCASTIATGCDPNEVIGPTVGGSSPSLCSILSTAVAYAVRLVNVAPPSVEILKPPLVAAYTVDGPVSECRAAICRNT